MRIALVNTISPFIRGGAEILVDDLKDQLERRGHQVILFRLPFPNAYQTDLPKLMLAAKLLDFTVYDRVIAFKFPAYCVCHSHKTLWMFHQFRQVYDLFGKTDGLADNEETRALKEIITNFDCMEIGDTEHLFVISGEVESRLHQYNGLASEIMTPPLLNTEQYHAGEYGDYLYYPSRINSLKRQLLAVEALHHTKTAVKLILDGICPDPEYDAEIQNTIAKYHLEDRVSYENRWVSDEEKIEKYSKCLGAVCIPYLEDSCSFVTYEAFYSEKPVIACTDSGGTKYFIEDGKNGYFAEPTPQSLAEKMDLLYLNKENAAAMGRCGRDTFLKRNITWDETIRRLLA